MLLLLLPNQFLCYLSGFGFKATWKSELKSGGQPISSLLMVQSSDGWLDGPSRPQSTYDGQPGGRPLAEHEAHLEGTGRPQPTSTIKQEPFTSPDWRSMVAMKKPCCRPTTRLEDPHRLWLTFLRNWNESWNLWNWQDHWSKITQEQRRRKPPTEIHRGNPQGAPEQTQNTAAPDPDPYDSQGVGIGNWLRDGCEDRIRYERSCMWHVWIRWRERQTQNLSHAGKIWGFDSLLICRPSDWGRRERRNRNRHYSGKRTSSLLGLGNHPRKRSTRSPLKKKKKKIYQVLLFQPWRRLKLETVAASHLAIILAGFFCQVRHCRK